MILTNDPRPRALTPDTLFDTRGAVKRPRKGRLRPVEHARDLGQVVRPQRGGRHEQRSGNDAGVSHGLLLRVFCIARYSDRLAWSGQTQVGERLGWMVMRPR